MNRVIGKKDKRQTGRETDLNTDRLKGKQAATQTHRNTDTQRDRQVNDTGTAHPYVLQKMHLQRAAVKR